MTRAIGFLPALKFVSHAAGVRDIRPYLNGVLFEFRESVLTLVATSGKVLAVADVDYDGSMVGDYIVPLEDVKTMLTVLKGAGTLDFSGCRPGAFKVESASFGQFGAACIEEGKFPDWRRVIPSGRPLGAPLQTFDTALLAKTFKAFESVADTYKSTQGVHVTSYWEGSAILISAPTIPFVNSARAVVSPVQK